MLIRKLKYLFKIFRFISVLLIAKFIYFCCVLKERLGYSKVFLSWTCIPGNFVVKHCFDFMKFAEKFCRKEIIAVSGTNGKSTTSRLLAEILQNDNRDVVHNKEGSNIFAGIVSALVGQIFPKTFDNFVYEAEETFLLNLCNKQHIEYLLLTNLFSDALLKNPYNVKSLIQLALDEHPDIKLILNADEPLFYDLKCDNIIRFGINNVVYNQSNEANFFKNTEIKLCSCGKEYQFSKLYYPSIGHYFCSCGVERIKPDIEADVEISAESLKLNIRFREKLYDFEVPLNGIYNAYNVLGAISCALLMNVEPKVIQNTLKYFKPFMGRNEKMSICGKDVVINLIKNNIGFEVVSSGLNIQPDDVILFAFNNKGADGGNNSWLKDLEISHFLNFENKIIVTGGDSATVCDMLSSLNCKTFNAEVNMEKALIQAINAVNDNGRLLVLANYTALLDYLEVTRDKNFIKNIFFDRIET